MVTMMPRTTLVLAISFGSLFASTASGSSLSSSVSLGDSVRFLALDGGSGAGRVASMDETMLSVVLADGTLPHRLSLDSLQSLEVYRAKPSRVRLVAGGSLLGLMAGLLVPTLAIGIATADCTECIGGPSPVVWGAAVGTVVGGAIGWVMAGNGKAHWESIPLPSGEQSRVAPNRPLQPTAPREGHR